jgi:prolyl-tRNA synthetase
MIYLKWSSLLIPSLREVPAEAEIVSHQLMIRAGMLRKLAAGVYSFLPLGWRVIKKIEQIVREEMDAKGAQELHMPALQPAELWQESGRWEHYGPELMRLNDRHERSFCLGPTHEEVITDLVRRDVKSYRNLPLNLYQVQTKFRDEIRPRFGVMRGREFIMKDAYSFDRDYAGLEQSYEKMRQAYCQIFSRCGLKYVAVEADSGAIGGSASHEFMVLADSGEDGVAFCESCQYAANVEKATCYIPEAKVETRAPLSIEEVYTPNQKTIEELAGFLNISPDKLIKTVLMVTEKEYVAVLVRGDREVNPVQVKNLLDAQTITVAGSEAAADLPGFVPGFIGPVNLIGVKILCDIEVSLMDDAVCGANKADYHLIHVQPGVSFIPDQIAMLRAVESGDKCPRCQSELQILRGIEVGHIFKLGTKYSEAMQAVFLDEEMRQHPFVMGCYGIGISRTMAAAIEQNFDDNGIIWPMALAPFQVDVIPVKASDPELMKAAEDIYTKLLARQLEVVLDDRDERAGVKFMDADLVGIPLKVILGPKNLSKGMVEIKNRITGTQIEVLMEDVADTISQMVKDLL